MAKCDYCGCTIFMGGVRAGQQRFCNKKCASEAYILAASRNISQDSIDRKVEEVWRGNCPKCNGPGPVDVYKSHQVWSAVVLTRWTSNSQVSCRSCATKRQAGALAMSAVFGWWGFPWGLILTPVQVTRNIIGMASGPDSSAPSADLKKLIRVHIGSQVVAQQQRKPEAPPAIQ